MNHGILSHLVLHDFYFYKKEVNIGWINFLVLNPNCIFLDEKMFLYVCLVYDSRRQKIMWYDLLEFSSFFSGSQSNFYLKRIFCFKLEPVEECYVFWLIKSLLLERSLHDIAVNVFRWLETNFYQLVENLHKN